MALPPALTFLMPASLCSVRAVPSAGTARPSSHLSRGLAYPSTASSFPDHPGTPPGPSHSPPIPVCSPGLSLAVFGPMPMGASRGRILDPSILAVCTCPKGCLGTKAIET